MFAVPALLLATPAIASADDFPLTGGSDHSSSESSNGTQFFEGKSFSGPNGATSEGTAACANDDGDVVYGSQQNTADADGNSSRGVVSGSEEAC